jgi:mercuric reductase
MLSPKFAAQDLPRTEIRPGVVFPDWTVVRSVQGGEALVAIFGAFRADECWRGYSNDEDAVRSTIIRHYAVDGRAPTLSELGAATRLSQDALRRLLRQLRDRDLVVMDEERIVGAYPLTSRKTEHQVHVGGKTVHAMCAIDALGVGAMLGRDVEVASACRQCGAAISAVTRGAGTVLAAAPPTGTLVWSGMRTDAGCAADTLCTVIAFFCSAHHLEAWRSASHPHAAGYRLSLDEALQVGRAIFGPTLAGLGRPEARGAGIP